MLALHSVCRDGDFTEVTLLILIEMTKLIKK